MSTVANTEGISQRGYPNHSRVQPLDSEALEGPSHIMANSFDDFLLHGDGSFDGSLYSLDDSFQGLFGE